MIKKYLAYFFVCGLLLTACNNSNKTTEEKQDSVVREPIDQPEEVQQISEVITRFVRAYISQDNEKLNALVHPELGMAIIYRPGAADTFALIDSFDFKKPVPEYYAYPPLQNDQVLTFEKLPSFDCGSIKWDKTGFYSDTTSNSQTQLLQTIVKFEEEFESSKYNEQQKKRIQELENGSYRVILAQPEESLIFHVKQFGTAWYVTLLDRAYGGCDA